MRAESFDGPHGEILRVSRGCEFCGCTATAPDPDGLRCCAECGMTTLDGREGASGSLAPNAPDHCTGSGQHTHSDLHPGGPHAAP